MAAAPSRHRWGARGGFLQARRRQAGHHLARVGSDGIRKRVDEERYTIRYSPRRAATWWVLSARLEATRLKRAHTLVQLSAKARLIPAFIRRRP